jgi:putative ABC transport system permease protein
MTVSTFIHDLRYGLRQWRRNPGFTAVAMLTLALGIGPNVAIFSVIWAVFFTPLPYPNGNQLVVIWTKTKGERNPCRADDYLQYLSQSKSFQHLDFFSWEPAHLTNTDPAEAEALGNPITPGFLTKDIGTPLAMGRDFLPEEGIAGNDHEVILAHLSWVNRFHSDPNVLGKEISIEGKPYTVVGVQKAGPHDSPGGSEFIVPLALNPGGHNRLWGNIFGRLKPGVTPEQAQAELNVIDQRLPATRQDVPREGWTISVEPLKNDWLDRKLERNLWLLLAAVGFVLLIACANVANLLLARGASRQREIAVRAAIGASRRRVIAQLLTESLTLAIPGGAIGIGLGWALIKVVLAIQPGLFEQVSEAVVELNLPVLLFAVGASLVAGIVFGCAPAWHAAKLNLTETLNQGSQSVVGGRRGRTQAVLVTAEFALAITLLAGAGMALHSFWKLSRIDLGVRTDHVLLANLRTPRTKQPTVEQISADDRQLLEKLRALPGVLNAGFTTNLPLEESGPFPFRIAGQPLADGNQPVADFESVTPSYFDALGIRLIKGRVLSDSDTATSTPVVMVSENFVKRYFPGVDPMAQRLVFPHVVANQKPLPSIEWQVVGVFRDVHNGHNLTGKTSPEVYVSFWQNPWPNVGLAVRTAMDPSLVATSVRATVVTGEAPRTVSDIDTIEHRVDEQLKGDRFGMVLFGAFAALALLLAALGIYGVMAFAVAQRRHEIGLRMALGAQPGEVLQLILASGMKLALLGIGAGLVGVYALGRLMRSTLYGIQTVDIASFAAVSFFLLAAALISSYIPARRAAKVDPMVALRYE